MDTALAYGRKPKHLEKVHVDMGRMCKLHADGGQIFFPHQYVTQQHWWKWLYLWPPVEGMVTVKGRGRQYIAVKVDLMLNIPGGKILDSWVERGFRYWESTSPSLSRGWRHVCKPSINLKIMKLSPASSNHSASKKQSLCQAIWRGLGVINCYF